MKMYAKPASLASVVIFSHLLSQINRELRKVRDKEEQKHTCQIK